MEETNPDSKWYATLSKERGTPSRCPFATVYRCPRYYQSLALMGRAGATSIDPNEDAKLQKKWSESELWPTTGEQAPALIGNPETPAFYNFCPEVIYDRFRVFASSLADYSDSIDKERAHHYLRQQTIGPNSWRWQWETLTSMHFSDCPLYSVLSSIPQPNVKELTDAPTTGFTVKSDEIWEQIKQEYGIAKRSFSRKIRFVTDRFKKEIIFRDIEHAYVLAKVGYNKPATILAGSVLEELLRLYLKSKGITLTTNRFDGYIKICEDQNLLKPAVHHLTTSFRHFRNSVHLEKESSPVNIISQATAKEAVASIFTIANDFK